MSEIKNILDSAFNHLDLEKTLNLQPTQQNDKFVRMK